MKDLRALGRKVADELDAQAADVDSPAARERFVRAASLEPRKRSLAKPVSVGLAIAAAAAVLFFVMTRRPAATAHYEAAGAPARVGVELSATSTPLEFSDGSRVDLHRGAKLRVSALEAHGATFVLESGNAHFDFADGKDAAWTLHAGNFDVHAGGARFELAFAIDSDEIDLAVESGHVELSGQCVERRAITAPAHVHVSCAESHAAPPSSAMASAPETPSALPKSPLPVRPSWRALAAQSRWNDALAAALPTFDDECDHDTAADLLALGDVARLARDAPHARHAYETLRARFPSDANAAVAAFSLGKLAFDEDHAYGEAGRAFDTYLREAPHGALARDALARSMEAHLRAGDRSTAQKLAQQYLDQYPGGPQEEIARGIVGR